MFEHFSKPQVALETTLLVHGVPRADAPRLARDLDADVRAGGARPVLIGVHAGRPIVGMTDQQLADLLAAPEVPKLNTGNLGLALHRGSHGATTVSATIELAAGAGVPVFATGGLGGVHRGYGESLDISADLAALSRWPVAVVCSGVKSILDVVSTREALETLGVPVVGFGTDRFPAFYQRHSPAGVDGRFDDVADLARFVRTELARTGRGIVVAHPIPPEEELGTAEFDGWLREAEAAARARGASGRGVTPAVLAGLHAVSGGRTLRANVALVRSNARLAGALARAMAE